ncbi:MAG TPA: hypothetical protein VE871_17420 [Longimicrobium sp.]|nr:hypothetical protein [Longimicrobium sp.]
MESKDPHEPGPPPDPVQEPWDYARVLELYNGLAERRGGWYSEADGRTEDDLRLQYLRRQGDCPDLRLFAEALFEQDQSFPFW